MLSLCTLSHRSSLAISLNLSFPSQHFSLLEVLHRNPLLRGNVLSEKKTNTHHHVLYLCYHRLCTWNCNKNIRLQESVQIVKIYLNCLVYHNSFSLSIADINQCEKSSIQRNFVTFYNQRSK